MSLLIQLRDRIKGIDTIKKITHAMRLISMSSRSRLKSKEETLREYINTATNLLLRIKAQTPDWNNPIINPPTDIPSNPLLILVGSQRGLCGNFNTVLFRFFEHTILNAPKHNGIIQIIPIGKKAVNYIDDNPLYKVIASYPELTAKTLPTISHALLELLMRAQPQFTHVVVFSNKLKTFFVQKPQQIQLIPFAPESNQLSNTSSIQGYYWEQSSQELLDQLAYQTLESHIHYILFQSLLAEHAARFITMDNATRNAQSLLEDTRLQYNKLRQAKITKELTELVSSL